MQNVPVGEYPLRLVSLVVKDTARGPLPTLRYEIVGGPLDGDSLYVVVQNPCVITK